MNVFDFREKIIQDYQAFSRSFATLRAEDIRAYVEDQYARQHFWPSPLVQLNPSFVSGKPMADLVAEGLLHEECLKIFRAGKSLGNAGDALRLFRHQEEALRIAQRKESYVLTTGTGSGKSLSYFIPIVDAVLRARDEKTPRKTSAIVVYPMNALCNSQMEELRKYLGEGYDKGKEPVTFARYTGQEGEEERSRIAAQMPDILLTNYMMLELLLTRQNDLDKAVMRNAQGLKFLVLDELHTYRGRQGADVAILVRRVREALDARDLLCVGTSATMASEGDAENRNGAVAHVASRLFGTEIRPENIVTETLQRITSEEHVPTPQELVAAFSQGVPAVADYETLRQLPLAVWIETNLGVEMSEGKWVRRRRPLSIEDAAELLARETGVDREKCRETLAAFLLRAYEARDQNGTPLFAFRLHQFISGAGDVFSTLEAEKIRFLTLDGQQFKPGDREKRLFNLAFCRQCGQEYYPVWARSEGDVVERIEPRDLGDYISEPAEEGEGAKFGFFLPDPCQDLWNPEKDDAFPEEWLEEDSKGHVRLKAACRKRQPRELRVASDGASSNEGLIGWFLPGKFHFCPRCGVVYDETVRKDLSKLSRLSSEGRSSATTILVYSALRWLLKADGLRDEARKLLGFSDNRQDASLQAGHFNDFIQILLLRGALLAALRKDPEGELTDGVLTQRIYERLWPDGEDGLRDFAANPELKGIKAKEVKTAVRDVLGYRLYGDLRRGWRLTNPNLEQLGLLRVSYDELENCCADESVWGKLDPLLVKASPEVRRRICQRFLDEMRRRLCIKTIHLDHEHLEQLRKNAYTMLREPWDFFEQEKARESALFVPNNLPPKERLGLAVVTWRSRFARDVRSILAETSGNGKLGDDLYLSLVADLARGLAVYGLVEKEAVDRSKGVVGYQINANALRWKAGDRTAPADMPYATENRFFLALYENVAAMLLENDRFLHVLEAREHTAQVPQELREEREQRFRAEKEPRLPVLFCSPTMELGVDIAQLNTVYLRNVPPTPANYAQRSGRAGRSGQPALVITYCAAQSPHDQYFFADPGRMVSGEVKPPALDLANEDLIRSHLHALWLSETGKKLPNSPREILDLSQIETQPIAEEYATQMDDPKVRERAVYRAQKVLQQLRDELTPDQALWYGEDWVGRVMNGAFRAFDMALDRWRTLYHATIKQLNKANDVLNNPSAPRAERKEATQRHLEAKTQQDLLLGHVSSFGGDFYTYRYLASQGFIPGYNFPRLPLLAYLPGRREKGKSGGDDYLSRSRFLALSEFGPRAIIYHEGSQFRVHKAILGVRDEGAGSLGEKLPVSRVRLCPECGYGHFGERVEAERCVQCDTPLKDGRLLQSLYRIENVSTQRVERITSDEEERQRLGYDVQTTFEFCRDEADALRAIRAEFREAGDENVLARATYAPAATLWRVNLGWRRRKNKEVHGFVIDPLTGYWAKDEQNPDDEGAEGAPTTRKTQRITPYVEDRRNLLLLFPEEPLEYEALTTLRYALKAGIERQYQLEESELAVELLPGGDTPHGILFYEASEGGAGVLTRLVADSDALGAVAKRALESCHFACDAAEWTPESLRDTKEACTAGCYRCLLSYYNQIEHAAIDRRNEEVLAFLCRLTRTRLERGTGGRTPEEHFDELSRLSGSSLERRWLAMVRDASLRLPDKAQVRLEAHGTRPDFVYSDQQALVYIDGPHHETDLRRRIDDALRTDLEDAGFVVVVFPKETQSWAPIFARYPDVFGKGKS